MPGSDDVQGENAPQYACGRLVIRVHRNEPLTRTPREFPIFTPSEMGRARLDRLSRSRVLKYYTSLVIHQALESYTLTTYMHAGPTRNSRASAAELCKCSTGRGASAGEWCESTSHQVLERMHALQGRCWGTANDRCTSHQFTTGKRCTSHQFTTGKRCSIQQFQLLRRQQILQFWIQHFSTADDRCCRRC
jgi:hypothetical protein